jgi:hypothetical protein
VDELEELSFASVKVFVAAIFLYSLLRSTLL